MHTPDSPGTPHSAPSTEHPPRTQHFVLVVLLLLGLAVRLAYLDVPPLSFHPTRQYRSALIARGESRAAMAPLNAPQRDAAFSMRHAQGAIEPEVMEGIAAWLYDRAGREDLRLPRLLSILAWLLGGLAVAALLRSGGVTTQAAMGALAFVLFVPFGVDASRAFMPDPLMTGLIMAAMAASLRHHLAATRLSLAVRVVAAGAAIFIKPMAVFFVVPVILALDVARLGLLRGAVLAALSAGLAMLPAAAHYGLLMSAGNPVAQNRIIPDLWGRPSYWSGWLAMLNRVIGWPALVIAAAALVLPASGRAKSLRLALAAAWLGYVAMGLTFTHHISTHDYYSLPAIPLAAASLGLALSLRGRIVAVVCGLGIIAGVWPALNARGYYGDVEAARQTAADYAHIGSLVRHSSRVVSLDGAYGYPLAYHALVVTSQLPLSIDRALSELIGRTHGEIAADFTSRGGEYFVGTIQPELGAQPNLVTLLDQRHVLLDRGGTRESWRYVVYDLTRIKLGASPETFSVFTRAGAGDVASDIQIVAPAGVSWRAVSADPARIRIEPDSGTGDTDVRAIATPGAPGQDGTTTVSLFSGSTDADPAGQFTVHWRTQGRGPNSPPFGFVDAPADPVTLGAAPVLFQGWALDDVKMVAVDVVVRDAGGTETVLGQTIRAGRRPDVAAAHPTAHDLERSAWHFVLERAKAPMFTPGVTLTVLFRARDADGATAVIGQRTVKVH